MQAKKKMILLVGMLVFVFGLFEQVRADTLQCCIKQFQFVRSGPLDDALSDVSHLKQDKWVYDTSQQNGCAILKAPVCGTAAVEVSRGPIPGETLTKLVKFGKEEKIDCSAQEICKKHISQEISKNCASKSLDDCKKDTLCFEVNNECKSVYDQTVCSSLGAENCAKSKICVKIGEGDQARCVSPLQAGISAQNAPTGTNTILPDCAFDGTCDNVNQVVKLAIDGAQKALGYMGALALVAFLYGGFTIIISAGSEERVKKGRDIMVAAVIGIIIAFSAFLMIKFLLTTLGVSDDFRAIGAPEAPAK